MGINGNGAQFLAYARSIGADFGRTMMIGRQNLYITPAEMSQALGGYGHRVDAPALAEICAGADGFSENLFRRLGAQDVHSLDYSPYQGATHVHDMNEPIPAELREQYTAVLDGGSLEHVFNFPVAIRNCMEMVACGGRLSGDNASEQFLRSRLLPVQPGALFHRILLGERL